MRTPLLWRTLLVVASVLDGFSPWKFLEIDVNKTFLVILLSAYRKISTSFAFNFIKFTLLPFSSWLWLKLVVLGKNRLNSSQIFRKSSADVCLFKVNNGKTKTKCKICSKLTIETQEWDHWSWLSLCSTASVQWNVCCPYDNANLNIVLNKSFFWEKFLEFPGFCLTTETKWQTQMFHKDGITWERGYL